MKLFFKLFLILIFIIAGCIKEEKTSLKKGVWSSNNPLNIPYRRRLNELESGNKLANGSFEKGRYFKDNYNTFEINGWKEMQGGITWVDKKRNTFNDSKIYKGTKALKLEKKFIDETENKHVGILSDFIKVIPGKYDLSFRIKLENIQPVKQRFGSRLMETVNIRVNFYDKNKIKLNGNMVNPITGLEFNNEFKAFPFSAYWQIDSMDWSQARGISYKFPFTDGIIPNETRYVRLYFGLNGTGTIWLDDISFKYSSDNFSVKEKTEPLFSNKMDQVDLLLPTPQHVEKKSFLTLNKGTDKTRIAIITPEVRDPIIAEKIARLNERIVTLSDDKAIEVSVISSEDKNHFSGQSIVFSIGQNFLSKEYMDSLPYDEIKNQEQSYFIKCFSHADKHMIFLDGKSRSGLNYSLQTLYQLFDDERNGYYMADVIDYPDVKKRGLLSAISKSLQEDARYFSDLRLTHIFFENDSLSNQLYSNNIKHLKKITEHNSLTPGISLNLYNCIDQNNRQLSGDQQIIKVLKEKVGIAKKHGYNNILIRADMDQFSCDFSFKDNTNKLKYRNLLDYHSEVLKEVRLSALNDTRISFLPSWSNSQCIRRSRGKGELYLSELHKKTSSSINFGWKGPDDPFYKMDDIEINYIEQILSKYPFLFFTNVNPQSKDIFDNDFISTFPGRARNCSMFSHFNLQLPDKFYAKISDSQCLIQHHRDNIFEKIRIASYADYLWNPDNYNPERSLFIILSKYFGQDNAINLVKFNDLIYAVYERYVKSMNLENTKKFYRSAGEYMNQLNSVYNQLIKNIQDEAACQALEELKKQTEFFYQKTRK